MNFSGIKFESFKGNLLSQLQNNIKLEPGLFPSELLFSVQIFDRDEPSREKEAYITVRASDNGQPQLDDACTIKIVIEDINDNQPVFDKVVCIIRALHQRNLPCKYQQVR